LTRVGLVVKCIFYLFGTFLHEIAHYGAASVLGRADGFSIMPRIEGDTFIFGSVRSRVRFKVLSSVVATAPVIWWAFLFLLLVHLQMIGMKGHIPKIHFSVLSERIRFFSLRDIFFLWLFIQMLWAGMLSLHDIKNFFKGLFSISGLLLITAATAIIYSIRY